MARFLVELTPSDDRLDGIETIGVRARAASDELSRGGTPVRFLRSVFLPEDGSCFLLYEARSPELARDAAALARLSVERVVVAVHLDDAPPAETPGLGRRTSSASAAARE